MTNNTNYNEKSNKKVIEIEQCTEFCVDLDSVDAKPYEYISFDINDATNSVTVKELEDFLIAKPHISQYNAGLISIIVVLSIAVGVLFQKNKSKK